MRGEVGTRQEITVAVVSMGSPVETSAFCRRERLPFLCLSDRARAGYRAYGLRRGSAVDVVGPKALLGYTRAATKGFFPSAPVGDVYQLGGVFLVGTDGSIEYVRYLQHAGDHPQHGELTRVVMQTVTAVT